MSSKRGKKYVVDWYDRPQFRHEPIVVLAKKWFDWLRERNYSAHTIRGKRESLHYFLEWCLERGVREAVQVTRPLVERYQRWCFRHRKPNGKKLTFNAQHTRLKELRIFFSWAVKRNYVLHNPAADIELPRLPRKLPRTVLTAGEAEKVMMVPDVNDGPGLRDRAMLEVLYSTGIRRMELLNLTIYDPDFERKTLFIREGKARKDRVVPIGERALYWLARYLEEVRPRFVGDSNETLLFTTRSGTPIASNSLSAWVRGYVKRAAVGKNGSCHLLRHTFATLMLENGADVRYIQHMLGHEDLSTTEIYTKVSITKLREVHTMAHPARLRDESKKRNKPDERDAG